MVFNCFCLFHHDHSTPDDGRVSQYYNLLKQQYAWFPLNWRQDFHPCLQDCSKLDLIASGLLSYVSRTEMHALRSHNVTAYHSTHLNSNDSCN